MARETFEIHCRQCPSSSLESPGAYFFVNWEMERTGQFIFVCPVCGHEHARTICDGVLELRDAVAHSSGGSADALGWERIVILKSAWHRNKLLEILTVPSSSLAETWLLKSAKQKRALPDDHA